MGFQREDFGGDGCSEEEGLAFVFGREDGEAGFEVGKHGAAAWGEESVGFIEDDVADAAEAADCVFARGFDVFC